MHWTPDRLELGSHDSAAELAADIFGCATAFGAFVWATVDSATDADTNARSDAKERT
jgi:hypothetical protein